MFRKPKRRNATQRQQLDADDEPTTTFGKSITADEDDGNGMVERKPLAQKSVLTFANDEEEEEESFALAKNLFSGGVRSNISSVHKVRKRREKSKVSIIESSIPSHKPIKEIKKEIKQETRTEIVISDDEDNKNGYGSRPSDSSNYAPLNNEDSDIHQRFPSSFSSDIPDAKCIYEARKQRELMRASGGVQPAIPLASQNNDSVFEDRHAQRSRLIREDDNDLSDEGENSEMGGSSKRFISSKSLLVDEEQQRRNEQLEALKIEQGGSDDEEMMGQEPMETSNDDYSGRRRKPQADGDSSDDEMERWEREQLQKAVGKRKIVRLHEEVTAYRKHYHEPQSLVNQDRYVDEDMDIEVVSHTTDPNTSTTQSNVNDMVLKRPKIYADMGQLMEKLEGSVISRREEIKTKQYQLEQYGKHLEENKESIMKMADANLQLERNLQQYQELKFYTDTTLNCLDEKITSINEIETAIFDLWKTRSNELSRLRAEKRNRNRFEHRHQQTRSTWNSDDEEMAPPDSYVESMKRLIERADVVFEDAATEYSDVGQIIRRFIDWFQSDPRSFREAFVAECIPKLVGPFVRIELFKWNPLFVQSTLLHSFQWYQSILSVGFNNEGIVDVDDPAISGLIPDIVEKIIVPKMTKIVNELWDPMSVGQTRRLVEQIDQFVCTFPSLNKESKFFVKLLNAMRRRAQEALQHEHDVPGHLAHLVTEIRREGKATEQSTSYGNGADEIDMEALLAQSQSILK